MPAKKSQVENVFFIRSAGVSWEGTEAFMDLTVPFSLELKLNILFFSTYSRLLCGIIPLQRWNALLFVSAFLSGSQQREGRPWAHMGSILLCMGGCPDVVLWGIIMFGHEQTWLVREPALMGQHDTRGCATGLPSEPLFSVILSTSPGFSWWRADFISGHGVIPDAVRMAGWMRW